MARQNHRGIEPRTYRHKNKKDKETKTDKKKRLSDNGTTNKHCSSTTEKRCLRKGHLSTDSSCKMFATKMHKNKHKQSRTQRSHKRSKGETDRTKPNGRNTMTETTRGRKKTTAERNQQNLYTGETRTLYKQADNIQHDSEVLNMIKNIYMRLKVSCLKD